MADNDNPEKSSGSDRPNDPGLEPGTTPAAAEEINPANDQRSLDIGESGQFAPGGYYNQHGVNRGDRLDLDEHTGSTTSGDAKK